MALNIKNERTVALIRELADATGQNMTSAVEQAIRTELDRIKDTDTAREARAAERRRRADAILEEIRANITAEQRDALRTAQQDMYDENGLPVW